MTHALRLGAFALAVGLALGGCSTASRGLQAGQANARFEQTPSWQYPQPDAVPVFALNDCDPPHTCITARVFP